LKNPTPSAEEEEIKTDIKQELQTQTEGEKIRAKALDLDSNDKPWDFFQNWKNLGVKRKQFRNC
jgi:hypothetical protein